MVKEKQIRTYDQDGFRRRAACICVHDPDESEVRSLLNFYEIIEFFSQDYSSNFYKLFRLCLLQVPVHRNVG